MKRIWLGVGAACFAALFLISGAKIWTWHQESEASQRAFEELSALVGQSDMAPGLSGKAEDGGLTVLEEYSALYEQNSDFVGWVQIEGTKIDYPVMQSPDDPDFYLKHDFEKQYNTAGTPYIQSDCDLLTSDNLIIYGHYMNSGYMFSALHKYTDMDFYNEYKHIRFDTKYSHGTYEVIAVFATTANEGGFQYHHFVDAEDEEAFDDYITACKELAFYDTGVTAQYGDRLITLSTCEYSHKNGRMVVVAKQISGD